MSHRSVAGIPLLLVVALVGARCGGNSNNNANGGTPDASVEGSNNNLGGNDGGTSCTAIATWNGVDPAATYVKTPQLAYNVALSFVDGMNAYQVLQMEDYHAAGVAYPKAFTFKPTDKYITCDVCLTLWDGCVDNPQTGNTTCQSLFFQQEGTTTITQATESPDAGRFAATIQNAKLVEWVPPQPDGGGDVAKPNGRCFQIGAASYDVSWP